MLFNFLANDNSITRTCENLHVTILILTITTEEVKQRELRFSFYKIYKT